MWNALRAKVLAYNDTDEHKRMLFINFLFMIMAPICAPKLDTLRLLIQRQTYFTFKVLSNRIEYFFFFFDKLKRMIQFAVVARDK